MNKISKNKWLSLFVIFILTTSMLSLSSCAGSTGGYGGPGAAGAEAGGMLIGAIIFEVFTPYYDVNGVASGMLGKVVDSETGEPIEGAVILMEWTKVKEGIPGLHTEPSKVVELLSDKEGKFEVSAVENPFIDPPEVTVYKKGYVCWNSTIIFPKHKKRKDFEWGKTCIFKLKHFKPEYSYIKHTSFIDSAIDSGKGNKKMFKEAYRWEELEASKEKDNRM